MRCPGIQELLKADYLDGEASSVQERRVRAHLEQCARCRKLEKELVAQRMIFKQVKQEPVPEQLWSNIRQAIITERLSREREAGKGLLAVLKGLTQAPKPAFAFSGAVTVIIFFLVLAHSFTYKKEPFGTLAAGENFAAYSLSGENGDFIYDLGTNIEESFLS